MEYTYIVYQYTFENNMVYIGRSRTDVKRYMRPEKYQDQYVGKMMERYVFIGEILLETNNIFEAYELEAQLIQEHWDHSYNAKQETDWYKTALRDLSCSSNPATLEDIGVMIAEWQQKKSKNQIS